MNYRIEHDSMGEVKVLSDKYWGAQTQRSLENFVIGTEKMPIEIIRAFGVLKLGCARANSKLRADKMTEEKLWELMTMETWTITYKADDVREEGAKISFKTPGASYEYNE